MTTSADLAEFPLGESSRVEAVEFDGGRVTKLVVCENGVEWTLSGSMSVERVEVDDEEMDAEALLDEMEDS